MNATTSKNPQLFKLSNKNRLIKLKPKSNLKSFVLGLVVLFTQNYISALSHSKTLNNATHAAVFVACPGTPTATSPQIICQGSTVAT